MNLNKKGKKNFLQSFLIGNGCKPFWETCKLYFLKKGIDPSARIRISEDPILKENEVVRQFNIYFQSITSPLWFFESSHEPEPRESFVNRYKVHPSIKKIKKKYITINPFLLWLVIPEDVLDDISTWDDIKSSVRDILLRILKDNEIFPEELCKWINNFVEAGAFPDPLKFAEITTTTHNKEDLFDKRSYWPVSFLYLISKVLKTMLCS